MASSTVSPAPAYRPVGALDAALALRPYDGPWSARLAAHLLRRAGFGGSPADVARFSAMRPREAVASLINVADTNGLPGPTFAPYDVPRNLRFASADEKREAFRTLRREAVANTVALQQWWLERMIATPAPLQEKMTLFWHGIYTTAAVQKQVSPEEVFAQNQLFRDHALGNARDLALRVSVDAAMLKYLDGSQNKKSHPNENYARELMELFTLGIGNYTEADVREGARAFTGFAVQRPLLGGGVVFDREQHDDGTKTFLGQTGRWGAQDAVRIIFQQPAAATYLATRLLDFFVYMDPEPELVGALAALIRNADFDLRPVMATLLGSNVFFSDRAYRALVKSPVEYVVGTYRLFGVSRVDRPALTALASMGQSLFYPPNVKGWPGGAAWLNSQTVLARENFANGFVNNAAMLQAPWLAPALRSMEPGQAANVLTATILQGDASPASASKLVSFLASGGGQTALAALSIENVEERVRGAAYLAMAMPAYQLA